MSTEGVRQDGTWDEHYRLWSEVRHKRGEDAQRWIQAARKRVGRNPPDDWQWLAEALADAERKWFVANVFKLHPVPRRLFGPMLRAGVLEPNPSSNRMFIEPCVESLGGRRVLEELLRYLESGSDAEKAGAVSALYWVRGNPRNEELDDLRERFRCRMLREFVDNPDLNVRRRIIPMLHLVEPEAYPEELRPLIEVAVQVARSHPDEYIRHRVEVQLGAGGPLLMAIPDTGGQRPDHSLRQTGPHPQAWMTRTEQLERRVRRLLLLFIAGLVLSGLTAFPLVTELRLLTSALGAGPETRPQEVAGVLRWLVTVRDALIATNARYPFLAYGTDWLAFAHLVIAVAFVGPWRDPVRNRWVVTFGLIACAGVVPLALVAGAVRGIPLYWRLIDCAFGVAGAALLWPCARAIQELEASSGGAVKAEGA
ncbi:MAG TPA: hypothetical protein VM890_00435 [Longimicrobium sp.]|nr:hypothetical protein [Longimicrobium sp.]